MRRTSSPPWDALVAGLLAPTSIRGTSRQSRCKPKKSMVDVFDRMEPGRDYAVAELAAMTGIKVETLKNRLARMRERGMLAHTVVRGRYIYRRIETTD